MMKIPVVVRNRPSIESGAIGRVHKLRRKMVHESPIPEMKTREYPGRSEEPVKRSKSLIGIRFQRKLGMCS
jgi:hypothetical protein